MESVKLKFVEWYDEDINPDDVSVIDFVNAKTGKTLYGVEFEDALYLEIDEFEFICIDW